MGDRLGEIL